VPTVLFKRKGLASVAVDVLAELPAPEGDTGARCYVVLGTTVPVAPIDKDGDTRGRENEVWTTCLGAKVKAIP
jgi:hypothetical protein